MKTKHKLCLILASIIWLTPVAGASAQFDAFRKFAKGETAPTKQIAYFKIKGALAETPTRMPPLFGSEPPLSLKELLERFKQARRDNDVVAVVVDLQSAALGFAQLQEIHESLGKFAAVDKEVYVHADSLSTGRYALATGASHLSMVPTGDLWLIGLYGETPYLRGALDKLGCVPDFEHCGDFKTGAESITRTGPSDESKEMTKWLVDAIYEDLVKLIAESRGMSPVKVRSVIDNGPYSAKEALEAGLIDSVKHRQEFIADIKRVHGEDVEFVTDYGKKDPFDIPDDNIFAAFEFLMKLFNPTPKVYTEPSVAIVYVEGAIVTGSAESSPFGTTPGAFSTTIRKALDKAAGDDTVKAVVLRVDSPGGSALASEIILNAAKGVAAKKPIVVSMGNVAGSGGYYVTCASETIFADSSTITASIGVLGGKLVTTGMWDKVGINWHAVQRGEMAGMLSSAKGFTDAERAKFKGYMNAVYEIFKGHVVAARGDRLTKPIDEIAGGRVFTARQAIELGLVDRIGGLEDAIKFAAKQVGLGEYEVRVIPEPASIFDIFMGSKGDDEFAILPRRSSSSLMAIEPFRTMLPAIARVDPLRAAAIFRTLQ
ncbi:MAG: signal peptide peptidase SppA, partial [Planctomycetes bacterium]|nr:signal peptide peptidase SppA [Planctomycetota bacterium]